MLIGEPDHAAADADYIARACNSHDALLAALETLLGWANIADCASAQALQVRDHARAAIARAKK